jgi:3-carboxy-cis,cis-muconate cycloisomerase
MNGHNRTIGAPQDLFSKASLWQAWLDVEVALARAQATLGIIPAEAASQIERVATVQCLGIDNLEREAELTQAPIVALARVLAQAAGPGGAFVHWGATTQNVMQTGRLLLMRCSHDAVKLDLSRAMTTLAYWANQYANTPMVARTNGQHAVPISFGFKVAGWIEALGRDAQRLTSMQERVFVLPFGGSVGAMHTFAGQGQALNQTLASILGLGVMLVPNRTVNDLFADYVVQLSLWASSIERIAGEIYCMMSTEIAEASEIQSSSVVGSSTMPHKANPKFVVKVIALASDLRHMASAALQATQSTHEGDAVANHLVASVVDRASPLAWRLSRAFADLLERIQFFPSVMRRNLQMLGPSIVTENLMMALAPHLGRNEAHDLIHEVILSPTQCSNDLIVQMADHPALKERYDQSQLAQLLDPLRYLGESDRIATQAAALAAEIARELCSGN